MEAVTESGSSTTPVLVTDAAASPPTQYQR
jgi:hypothetical protein